MSTTWRLHTRSGSRYLVTQDGDSWTFTAEAATGKGASFIGTLYPIVPVNLAEGYCFVAEAAQPGRWPKDRSGQPLITTRVVRLEPVINPTPSASL